jgi:hypothetical protein
VGKGEAVATEDPCPLSGPVVLLPGLFPCAPLEAFRSVPKLKGLRLGVTDLELARVGER